MLRYDASSERYIGQHLTVSLAEYLAAFRAIVAAGYTPAFAGRTLRDEAWWSLDRAGVEPLLRTDDVVGILAEAEAILRLARPV
jgi:hypothetical protein